MITRIQKKRRSTVHGEGRNKSVLDYNEEKVHEGLAECVLVRNIRSNDPGSIYDTFEEYEENPAISVMTQWKNFHMTVNPDPEDEGLCTVNAETGKMSVNEPKVLEYIDEVMDRLGFGDQPYAVYRHFDIDREHYHIVSTRVKKNGIVISDSYFELRVQSIQKELSVKYGYNIGLKGKNVKVASADPEVVRTRKFDPKAQKTMANMTALLEDGLKYDFTSFAQFQSIMQAMGLKLTRYRRKDGGYNVIARGIGDIKDFERMKKSFTKKNGATAGMDSADPFEYMFTGAGRYYSFENDMGIAAYDRISEKIAFNKRNRIHLSEEKVALIAVSDWIMKHTTSEDMYCRCLDQLDISHTVIRGEDGTICRVILVNRRKKAIADTCPGGGLSLSSFIGAEKNKSWDPQKKYRGLSKSLDSLEEKPAMSTADIQLLKDDVNNHIIEFRRIKNTRDLFEKMKDNDIEYGEHGSGLARKHKV